MRAEGSILARLESGIRQIQQRLSGLGRKADELNRKLDLLLALFDVRNRTLGPHMPGTRVGVVNALRKHLDSYP